VLAGQLGRILELSRRPNVTLRVLRMTDGALLTMLEAFAILDLEAEENAFLYREKVLDDELVDDVDTVRRYRSRFEEGWDLAMSEPASTKLIEARRAELPLDKDPGE
jgi:hypothetical protein